MKKFLVLTGFIALLCFGLQSCNQPVNPQIIGTSPLCYDDRTGDYFVEINNASYPVDRIIDTKAYDKDATKYVGMLVTAFIVPDGGVRFIAGRRDVSEIEDAYTQNFWALWICVAIVAMLIGLLAWPPRNKTTPPTNTQM